MDLRRDDGTAAPLMVLVLLVATVMMWSTVAVAERLVERSQAQAAADAAALAGAGAGPEAAREVAAANGAVLVGLAIDGVQVFPPGPNHGHRGGWIDGVVTVEVRFERARATAAATGS